MSLRDGVQGLGKYGQCRSRTAQVPPSRRRVLEQAKDELRGLYQRFARLTAAKVR
jgi:hypothetical protein